MAILKYCYLISGFILYIGINVISYTSPAFEGDLMMKIIYSTVSMILLILDYMVILKTEMIMKKPFKQFSTYTKIMLYVGIVVIPLISLYYGS